MSQVPPSMTQRLSSHDRLKQLEKIEQDLTSAMQSAATSMMELSKDKSSIKQVENHAAAFLEGISTVEADLSKQIQYLTQVSSGQAHEGSSYSSQKVLQMAWHRLEHAKSRLAEFEMKMNTISAHHPPHHLPQQQPQQTQLQQQLQHQGVQQAHHLQQTPQFPGSQDHSMTHSQQASVAHQQHQQPQPQQIPVTQGHLQQPQPPHMPRQQR